MLEERRMHCDSDPGAQLGEAVQAALFTHHPYGIPVIGWGHEIEGLKREDALAYYKRFYTPENAILVVAGDVEPDEARALAEETYGKIKPRGAKPERVRPMEAPTVANRLVKVADEMDHRFALLNVLFEHVQRVASESLEVLLDLDLYVRTRQCAA